MQSAGLGQIAEPDSEISAYCLNCAGAWQCFGDNDLRGRKTLRCRVWQLDAFIDKSMSGIPKWRQDPGGAGSPVRLSGAWNVRGAITPANASGEIGFDPAHYLGSPMCVSTVTGN